MRRIFLILIAVICVVLSIAACGGTNHSAAQKAVILQQNQQGQGSLVMDETQPSPVFNHSQIRQELIDIETAQAEGATTTSFFENYGVTYGAPGAPKAPASCPSIGAPVPTTDELTNPQQLVRDPNNGSVPGSVILDQEDPNGVYTGDSSGTYVMCVDAQGQVYAHYWEGPVEVMFGPATWNDTAGGPVLSGTPSNLFQNIKSTHK